METRSGAGVELRFAVTPGSFPDDVINEALAKMRGSFIVRTRPLRRGGSVLDAEILVETTRSALASIGPTVGASAVWEGLTHLLTNWDRPLKGPFAPLVTFQIRDGAFTTEAYVRIDDPELLRAAMAGLPESVNNLVYDAREELPDEFAFLVYDPEGKHWTLAA